METIEEFFPVADSGLAPAGHRLICQIRKPKLKTKGGIILTEDSRDVESDNTQVAKIVAIGEGAFKSRTDLKPWPEGAWCEVGDFVRVPKYASEHWAVKTGPLEGDRAIFIVIRDHDVIGKITGDPLAVVAYV